jgi:hypothetical protein
LYSRDFCEKETFGIKKANKIKYIILFIDK